MRILLTGGSGMLGKAILREAHSSDFEGELVFPTSSECNLRNAEHVDELFRANKFDLVIHCAAVVGGIQANINSPVEFLSENLKMNTNVIDAAFKNEVDNFLFLGSSCMYPKDYDVPLKECHLLQGPLEPTNEGYAISKIAGAKLCEYISRSTGRSYRTIIPCNLYGPGDNFSETGSHMIPAAIRKIFDAVNEDRRSVTIWGDGTARREFLYVDDLAHFILTTVKATHELPQNINVGLGFDYSITEYYEVIADVCGFDGHFEFDVSKPSGMRRKLLDISLAKETGWKALTELRQGIAKTLDHYKEIVE